MVMGTTVRVGGAVGSASTGCPCWPSKLTCPQPSNPEISKLQWMSQTDQSLFLSGSRAKRGFYIYAYMCKGFPRWH